MKRASASAHLAAGEVDDRLQRHVDALATDQPLDPARELLPPRPAGAGQLLLARGPLALGREVGLDLELELAQLVREGDEAHHQADGRDRELAGTQGQRRPPGARVGLGGEDEREALGGRERERGDHAHRAPGGGAVLGAPPQHGGGGRGEHEHGDDDLEGAAVLVLERHEVAQRHLGDRGPGEQQRRRAGEQRDPLARRAHAGDGQQRRGGQARVPDHVAGDARVGRLLDRPAGREDRRAAEQRQHQAGAGDPRAGGHPAQLRVRHRACRGGQQVGDERGADRAHGQEGGRGARRPSVVAGADRDHHGEGRHDQARGQQTAHDPVGRARVQEGRHGAFGSDNAHLRGFLRPRVHEFVQRPVPGFVGGSGLTHNRPSRADEPG